jgi:16S rRNA (cytosine1402-N4)-methyltransferase
MRMNPGEDLSAAEWIAHAKEAEIADVLYRYGDERASRRIARRIVEARGEAPITRTAQLAEIIARAMPGPRQKIHPATRSFQAIRIRVNDELGELERGLEAAEAVLKPGGRLAVVSFHSLEDRIVKRFLAERSGGLPSGSRHLPAPVAAEPPSFERPPRAERPSDAEVSVNPRARSATLRWARRTSSPAWGRRPSDNEQKGR